jgi:hypothetical protein
MLMAGLGPPEALAPLTPVATTVHSYCTLPTLFGLLKMMFAVPPSHTVNTVLLIANVGTGSTVISTSNDAPLQPFALGVTVYVTVPCVFGDVVVKACAMVLPLPAVAPLTPVADTVQLYVVPLTAFGLLNAMLVVLPLQIV